MINILRYSNHAWSCAWELADDCMAARPTRAAKVCWHDTPQVISLALASYWHRVGTSFKGWLANEGPG